MWARGTAAKVPSVTIIEKFHCPEGMNFHPNGEHIGGHISRHRGGGGGEVFARRVSCLGDYHQEGC